MDFQSYRLPFKFKIIIFLMISFQTQISAIYRYETRWLENKRQLGVLQKDYTQYEYPSCQQYNDDVSESYFAACEDGEMTYQPLDRDSIRSLNLPAKLLTKQEIQHQLLSEVKSSLVDKMKTQFQRLGTHYECLKYSQPSTRISKYCQNIIEGYLNSTQEYLPKMRTSLSMMQSSSTRITGESTYGVYSGNLSRINPQRDIAHPYYDHEIDKLSDQEYEEIKNQKILQREKITNEFFKEYRESHPNIDERCSSNKLEDLNSTCRMMIAPSLFQYTIRKENEVKNEAQEYYRNVVSQYPHLPFMKSREIPLKREDQISNIKVAIKELYDQAKAQFDQWENAELEEYTDFFHYPKVIENILEDKIGHSKIQCDVLEGIHQEYGPGGDREFYRNIGIALGTLAGGGVCVFTGGLACAVGVAIIGEAASIIPQQQQLTFSESLFRSQIIDSGQVNLDEEGRDLSVALAPLSLIGLKGAQFARSSTRNLATHEMDDLTRSITHSSSALTQRQLKDLISYQATTPLQNRAWIELAKSTSKGETLFFDIENAAIKRLNDTLGDKNLVTSLTNLHKTLVKTQVDEWLKKYPKLDINFYSDFKSLRIAINGDLPLELRNQIKKEFSELLNKVNTKFQNKVNQIDSDFPEVLATAQTWFKAGIGETADQAGLAARSARNSSSSLVDLKTVHSSLSEELNSIHSLRKSLQESLPSKLIDHEHGVPNMDVIEFYRKKASSFSEEDPNAFLSSFKNRFGVEINVDQASELVDYLNRVDQFSPGLWVEKRVVANLDDAEYGGFSADFKGLGAKNLAQVAIDLEKNPNSLEQTLETLRRGEGLVTESFDDTKNFYRDVITKTLQEDGIATRNLCSGDDCVSLPTQALPDLTKAKILASLAKYGPPDGQRLAFIPPGIEPQKRTILAVHGELIEKQVRGTLTGFSEHQISPDVLKKVAFAVDMPSELGKGRPRLMISSAPDLNLTLEQRKVIEESYSQIMKKVNADILAETGKESLYDPGQLIWVTQ